MTTPARKSSKPSWLTPVAPTVAIEIASRRVTVAELSYTGQGAVVSACATEGLPPGAVAPALTGTNIPQVGVVADALRRALDKAGLRSTRRCALIVPDSIARVSLLPFETLPAKPAELDQLVQWQVKKATPFPLEDARISHFVAQSAGESAVLAAIVARKDVIAQYEAVTSAVAIHAGIVDLASVNVMNTVIGSGTTMGIDWLLVCVAGEATTIAILRGQQLMFYRHRTALDDEPLPSLVHQTAMYYEDRLGGSKFARVWLSGASLYEGATDKASREIAEGLGVPVESVDIRSAAALRDRISAGPDVLDTLAAPVGALLRDGKVA